MHAFVRVNVCAAACMGVVVCLFVRCESQLATAGRIAAPRLCRPRAQGWLGAGVAGRATTERHRAQSCGGAGTSLVRRSGRGGRAIVCGVVCAWGGEVCLDSMRVTCFRACVMRVGGGAAHFVPMYELVG